MATSRRALCFVPVLLAVVSPATVHAQGDEAPQRVTGTPPTDTDPSRCTAEPEACGRQAFEAGVLAYKQGDWESAVRLFNQALAYKRHPAIILNLGLAEAELGRYVDAMGRFGAVAADETASAELRKQAARERSRAEGELAAMELDLPPGEASPRVSVDGVPVDVKDTQRLDPGPHHIEIVMPSGAVIRRDVTLAPRERLRLTVDRTRELVVVPEREREVTAPKEAAPPRGPSPVWFYVGAAATIVVGGVATWSALDTASAHDDYEKVLTTASQAEIDRRVEDGHALEARTNGLWIATGVLALGTAAVGVFLVDWGNGRESTVAIGPSAVAWRGTF